MAEWCAEARGITKRNGREWRPGCVRTDGWSGSGPAGTQRAGDAEQVHVPPQYAVQSAGPDIVDHGVIGRSGEGRHAPIIRQ
ncbi:hypothetical protein GCM10010123_25470 [Pilimelia anulata]|uniref:Uncharacterized protein n=1 Tax=Pilimelia anulata TaxID=53371 RepID=A0A8J3F8U5_9ACTN|nr:hypothetical protein GCM10010123_25470 [Pilimelia anulata]